MIEELPTELKEKINHSLIIIDKPKGPTSHEISAKVRDLLGIKKASHTGTLDPNVTGVLVILLGESVKLQRLIARQPKEYVCVMHLHSDVPPERIKEVVESFKGKIKQKPPVKSAVSRKERTREIYEINVLEIKGRDVLFQARVEAGTYIRTLCVQIGEKLGTKANMKELRRTYSGVYSEDEAIDLLTLKDEMEFFKEGKPTKFQDFFIPMEEAFKNHIKITIKNSFEQALRNGSPIRKKHIKEFREFKKGELILVENENKKIVALAEAKFNSKDIKTLGNDDIICKTDRIIN